MLPNVLAVIVIDSNLNIYALYFRVQINKVQINKVPIEMEVESGAKRSTVSLPVYQNMLSDVCELRPSLISLHQYDKLPLTIAEECQG